MAAKQINKYNQSSSSHMRVMNQITGQPRNSVFIRRV